ncbi:beta-1,3-galactosyltransferase 2-like [Betta splendens]|uniref:Hexosyltransferase n=1 Tax=Betta splendens TaxID=158456 RepID=A0A6P7M2F6_BETSP|nr:beta-1,3-galactosyltransferase 2-like [Betta splendens]
MQLAAINPVNWPNVYVYSFIMLNRCEEGHRQGVADFHVRKSWRLSSSQRRCLFLILLLAAVWFVCKSDMRMIHPELWNPFSRGSQAVTASVNDSSPTEAPGAGGPGVNVSSPLFLQTTLNTSTEAANTTTQITTAPVPYTSPGPYFVEYPHDYHFTINEPHTCEEHKPFVVLVVPVEPSNRLHRDVIRNTWGGETLVLGKAVKLLFMVGRHVGDGAEAVQEQLLQESRRHRDVIQSDFQDCYKNLTIKTMVMLEWLDFYCSGASYAMKVDSDTFLNGHNLVNMLLTAPRNNYMTGLVASEAAVLRDLSSKWYLPVDLYPQSHYPRYALGLGYVLSMDLPRKLVQASKHVKALYIEDVYLGLCMEHAGIPPTNPPGWNYFNVGPVAYSRCAYSKLIVTTTEQDADRVEMWRDFQRPGTYC